METSFIVANLKSFLTLEAGNLWLNSFKNVYKSRPEIKVVVCPPFTLLQLFRNFIDSNNLDIALGGQDVSAFDEGPYTGEINAKQLRDFATYVLIGHSERRINFGETEGLLAKKIDQALDNNLIPLYFVQEQNQFIPSNIKKVIYEPPGSISGNSGGVADNPEDVSLTAENILRNKELSVLYGGSVNASNVRSFTENKNISGVVVGGASLEAEEFARIIQNA